MMEAAHAKLGTLVRTRRDQAGLSQQALANAAGVSRESVNRLENATGKWAPRPHKTAQILAVLDVTPDEVIQVIPDDELRDAVLNELVKLADASFTEYVQKTRPVAHTKPASADLVLLSPSGVTVVAEVKAPARQAGGVRRELSDLLTPAGWVVTSPV